MSTVIDGWSRAESGTVVSGDRAVHVEFVWGTAITLQLHGIGNRAEAALEAIAACCAWFAEVDQRFSTYKVLSEVSAARNGIARPSASPDFVEVERACRQAKRDSLGAFDPWSVPGGYDPSGYVKGWAAGRASRLLTAAGFADHAINAGGDIVCAGDHDPGSGRGWPIGVVNPHDPTEVIAVVDVRDAAIATSGRYERGDHVIDPRTGGTARGADSATVVGPDPGRADALASAALVDGPASAGWFASLGPDWSLLLVVDQRTQRMGPAFEPAAAGSAAAGTEEAGSTAAGSTAAGSTGAGSTGAGSTGAGSTGAGSRGVDATVPRRADGAPAA